MQSIQKIVKEYLKNKQYEEAYDQFMAYGWLSQKHHDRFEKEKKKYILLHKNRDIELNFHNEKLRYKKDAEWIYRDIYWYDCDGFLSSWLHRNGTYFDDNGLSVNWVNENFYKSKLKEISVWAIETIMTNHNSIEMIKACDFSHILEKTKKYYLDNKKYIAEENYLHYCEYIEILQFLKDRQLKNAYNVYQKSDNKDLLGKRYILFFSTFFDIDSESEKIIQQAIKDASIHAYIQTNDFLWAFQLFYSTYIENNELLKYLIRDDIQHTFSEKIIKQRIKKHIVHLASIYDFFAIDQLMQVCFDYWINIIEIKKEAIKNFFWDPQWKLLNDEKYTILANINNDILVQARAWTGKTHLIKYAIKLLTEWYKVDPNRIFAFAFNNDTAKNIISKIQELWVKEFVSAMTFHSFAMRVLARTVNTKYDILSDKKNDPKQKKYINKIMTSLFIDHRDDYKKELYEYFRADHDIIETARTIEKIQENEYNFIRSNEKSYVCLNGDTMKSMAEKRLGDFLFEHDIDFIYEFQLGFSKDEHWIKRHIRPDFTLINKQNFTDPWLKPYKVVIEFWWRPRNEDYQKTMNRKKERYEKKEIKLIELSIYDINYRSSTRREEFEEIIKQRLSEQGIRYQKRWQEELYDSQKEYIVWSWQKKWKLLEQIMGVIKKAKQYKWSVNDFQRRYQSIQCTLSTKLKILYKYVLMVYDQYDKKCKEDSYIDFDDSVRYATDKINEFPNTTIKIWTSPAGDVFHSLREIDYIFIDEYQDFSLLFHELIQTLRVINPWVKVIAVWDDRQLINSFAWSDIRYIKKFSYYYPQSKVFSLLKTQRCPNKIIQLASRFMEWMWEWWTWEEKNREIKWYNTTLDVKEDRDKKQYKNYVCSIDERKFFWSTWKDEIWTLSNWSKRYCVKKDYCEYGRLLHFLYWIIKKERLYSDSYGECSDQSNQKKTILILYRKNTITSANISLKALSEHLQNIWVDDIIDHYEKKLSIYVEKNKIKNNIENLLTIQSIHASKWWEADIVVILWIGERWIYPMTHPDNVNNTIFLDEWESIDKICLDEERRLFYVALTRTKHKLYYLSDIEIPDNADHWQFLLDQWWVSPY